MAWALILVPLLISCVTLGCLLNLSGCSAIVSKVEILKAATSGAFPWGLWRLSCTMVGTGPRRTCSPHLPGACLVTRTEAETPDLPLKPNEEKQQKLCFYHTHSRGRKNMGEGTKEPLWLHFSSGQWSKVRGRALGQESAVSDCSITHKRLSTCP